MVLETFQCRFCHRPVVQWMDVGDDVTHIGLCSRHSTLEFRMEQFGDALRDFGWAFAEAVTAEVVRVQTFFRERWRRWRWRSGR